MSRIIEFVRKLIAWGQSLVRDPASGDASSARVIALTLAVGAVATAILSVYKHFDAGATVAALTGGGIGNILSRTKAGSDKEPQG